MKSSFCALFACIALTATAATLLAQESVLVQMERRPSLVLSPTEPAHTFDLTSSFQKFPSPGPVVTFVTDMAVPAGTRVIDFFGSASEFNVYETADPAKADYDNFNAIFAQDFVFAENRIEVQLLPQSAPQSVANFLTYAADDAFDYTIIHQSTRGRFVQELLQAGSFTVHQPDVADTGAAFLDPIPQLAPVPLEYGTPNAPGTLAVARALVDEDGGASGFFFNVSDNAGRFGEDPETSEDGGPVRRAQYAVFGELLDPNDLSILEALADVRVWNPNLVFLDTGAGNSSADEALDVFRRTFPNLPLWTFRYYFDLGRDKQTFVSFRDIEVPTGDGSGLDFSYTVVTEIPAVDANGDPVLDDDGNETFTAINAHTESFAVGLDPETGELSVSAIDTGAMTLDITAVDASTGQTATHRVTYSALHPDVTGYFESYTNVAPGGWYETWYGWVRDPASSFGTEIDSTTPDADAPGNGSVSRESGGWFWHPNHTYQFAAERTARENQFYIFDSHLASWLLIERSLFPFIYLDRLDTWLYYQEGSSVVWDPTENGGSWVDNRWFNRTTGDTSEWVQGKDL